MLVLKSQNVDLSRDSMEKQIEIHWILRGLTIYIHFLFHLLHWHGMLCKRNSHSNLSKSGSEKERANVIWYSILKYICGYRIVPISKVNQLPFGGFSFGSFAFSSTCYGCLSVCLCVCVWEREIDTFNKIFIILHIDFIMETWQFKQLFFAVTFDTLTHTHVCVSVCLCLCA